MCASSAPNIYLEERQLGRIWQVASTESTVKCYIANKIYKILSILIILALLISSNPTMTVRATTGKEIKTENLEDTKSNIYLENIPIIERDAYNANMGDSFVYPLGKHQWTRGNVGIDGNTYSHGIEVWVARWNFKKEKSWTYATFDLDKQYSKLSGSALLIKSYNVTDFDTTLYFYGDGQLIQSYRMTPQTMPFDIVLDVFGVDNLKIYAEDNDGFQGGTSFGLTDMILTKSDDSDKEKEESNSEIDVPLQNGVEYRSKENLYHWLSEWSTFHPVGNSPCKASGFCYRSMLWPARF